MPATEIQHAFRGPWRVIVIVLPLLAALTAGLVVGGSIEPTYRATALVNITEYADAATTVEVRSAIDEFDSTLSSDAVTHAVEEAAPGSDGIVESRALGDGGGVEVALVGDDRADLEPGLDAGVRTALTIIAETEQRRADRDLVSADRAAAENADRLRQIEEEAGTASLDLEVQRRSADLLALRNQIAASANDAVVQESLRATQREKQEELDVIESQLLEWTATRARYDLAVASSAAASLRLQQIGTVQDELDSGSVLASVEVTEESTTPDLLRATVAAAVLTAAVVVGAALLLGGLTGRSRRRERPVRDDAPDPDDEWIDDEGWDDRYLDERDGETDGDRSELDEREDDVDQHEFDDEREFDDDEGDGEAGDSVRAGGARDPY